MLTDADIDDIAQAAAPRGAIAEPARDLREGRVFLFRWPHVELPPAGTAGLIVHKRTGDVFVLGSINVDEDIDDYDHGFRFQLYDLVITSVRDFRATRDALMMLGATVVEPEYASGTVWRVARPLTRKELNQKLESLPCVFPGISLRGRGCKILREAERTNIFAFEALEYPRRELAPEWDRRRMARNAGQQADGE